MLRVPLLIPEGNGGEGNMLKMLRQGKVQNMSIKPTTVEIFLLRNQFISAEFLYIIYIYNNP